jgi:hypothetical protein
MTSTFGWLDTDEDQRKKMLEVVELFKDDGTVDELGVGSIRDTIANALFPGTSVLHTRLRYVLFIPWLLESASRKSTPADMSSELRRLEVKLIYSLLKGGETEGVIGGNAREKLKRMPSAAYWAVLRRWDIRLVDTTIEGFFRRVRDQRELSRVTVQSDDPEARETLPRVGLDPNLPKAPLDLLRETTFELRPEEESYLSDLIAASTDGSLLSWLVRNPPKADASYVWQLDNVGDFPEHLGDLVDHGRRFHTAIHGAPLLYNLLLAERSEREDLTQVYRDEIATWRQDLSSSGVLLAWDRSAWWSAVHEHKPGLSPLTKRFVDWWLDIITLDSDVANHDAARSLVGSRERQIKGGRARLVNQAALDRWTGRSGLVRLDYRWQVTQRLLFDLYDARGVA